MACHQHRFSHSKLSPCARHRRFCLGNLPLHVFPYRLKSTLNTTQTSALLSRKRNAYCTTSKTTVTTTIRTTRNYTALQDCPAALRDPLHQLVATSNLESKRHHTTNGQLLLRMTTMLTFKHLLRNARMPQCIPRAKSLQDCIGCAEKYRHGTAKWANNSAVTLAFSNLQG